MAGVAEGFEVSRNTANAAILEEGRRVPQVFKVLAPPNATKSWRQGVEIV